MKLEGRGKGSRISCVCHSSLFSWTQQVSLAGIPHAPHICARQYPVVQAIRFINPGPIEIYIDLIRGNRWDFCSAMLAI